MKYKYIFIGTSRSGKSTACRELLKKTGGIYLDIVDYVYSFIKRENISQLESNRDLLKIPYEELCKDLEKGKQWDILELASDFPEIFLPKVFSITKTPIRVVYCRCPLDICLKRNEQEERRVPEEIIYEQHKYDENYYRTLVSKYGAEFDVLDTAS